MSLQSDVLGGWVGKNIYLSWYFICKKVVLKKIPFQRKNIITTKIKNKKNVAKLATREYENTKNMNFGFLLNPFTPWGLI